MTPLRRRMIEDMTIRNLRVKTIEDYVRCVARYARHFGRSPEQLGIEHIRSYLLHLIEKASEHDLRPTAMRQAFQKATPPG
jgi:integrase/recombinase XerD